MKERIKLFIKSLGISVALFEKNCGLSNGAVNKMADGTRTTTLDNISNVYPQLNMNWVKTGEGEMIISSSQNKGEVVRLNRESKGAPVYNIDATCGADVRDLYLTDERIIGYVDLPEIRPNTHIIRANGDSMKPVINDGNLVALREVSSWDTVFYGQIYLVVLEEYRMLKYIRRYEPDEENYVILRSENPNYDDIKVEKKKIIKLFIVENILSVKVQL